MEIQLLIIIISVSVSIHSHPTSPPVTLIKDDRVHPGSDGSFSYKITLSDGTKIVQSGNPEPSTGTTGTNPSDPESAGVDGSVLVIRGEYTFIDPQGMTHKVTYVADKNGFRPEGDDIPKINVGVSSSAKNKSEEPLKTISSSLFTSPSGDL